MRAFIFFFLFFCLSQAVASQSDSCDSTLSIGELPFNISSAKCTVVWTAEDFILRYAQISPAKWSFVLSAPDRGTYVALGFSSNGRMVGSSSIVGWAADSGGNPGIKQYFLGGLSPSDVAVDSGKLKVNSSRIVKKSSRVYLVFQLESTTQPSSRIIYAVGPARFQPIPPSFTLAEHREALSTILTYSSGQSVDFGNENKTLRRAHGIVNTLAWGILMIIGVLVARYMRSRDPLWFYSHLSIQAVTFAFGLVGVVTGFVLERRSGEDVEAHKAIGILILVLGSLQATAVLVRPNKSSKVRKYWNWFHHYSGRVAVLFSVANVLYGFHLGEEDKGWQVAYGVVFAVLVVVAVVLEVRLWKK